MDRYPSFPSPHSTVPAGEFVGVILADEEYWLLQHRDDIESIANAGCMSVWGGKLEPEDNGDFVRGGMRELSEETDASLIGDELHFLSDAIVYSENKNGAVVPKRIVSFLGFVASSNQIHVFEGQGKVLLSRGNMDDWPDIPMVPGLLELLQAAEQKYPKAARNDRS
jgi:ADP-ribose pyrophosphatase YjhB (NUDIX family)